MPAAAHNFTIERGATWEQVLEYLNADNTPFDLTGATAKMQLRAAAGKPLQAELSTENGRIVLTPAAGLIALKLTAAQTEEISPGAWAYDLELYLSSGTVVRLIEGRATIRPQITADA